MHSQVLVNNAELRNRDLFSCFVVFESSPQQIVCDCAQHYVSSALSSLYFSRRLQPKKLLPHGIKLYLKVTKRLIAGVCEADSVSCTTCGSTHWQHAEYVHRLLLHCINPCYG